MNEASPPPSLSKRQLQIAEIYVRSASYRQVADSLCLAPSTVRTHISAIYKKLGVTSKIALLQALAQAPAGQLGSAAPPGAPTRPSVVVLPFENRTGEWLPDYISYGLIDGVTSTLSRFRNLFVVSSDSCMSRGDGPENALTTAGALGVRYAVRGGFWRAGEQVRVSAEVIDIASKGQIWTGQFSGEWADIVAAQDELARSVASNIAAEIEANEMQRVRGRSIENLDAWELYYKAYVTYLRIDSDSSEAARDFCRRAIALDENFAAPHSLLARMYFYDAFSGRSKALSDCLELGVAHAQRALSIDDRDAEGYTVLGYNLAMRREFDRAYAAINRGLDVNPSSSELYNARTLVHLLHPEGRAADAIADTRRALSLSPNDPLRWTFYTSIGWAILKDASCGTLADAIEAFHQASVIPAADWQVFLGLALAHLSSGNHATACEAIKIALARQPNLGWEDILRITTPLLKLPELTAEMQQIQKWLQQGAGP